MCVCHLQYCVHYYCKLLLVQAAHGTPWSATSQKSQPSCVCSEKWPTIVSSPCRGSDAATHQSQALHCVHTVQHSLTLLVLLHILHMLGNEIS